jgi:fructose/tagatose bisphosphate aldolase
LEQAKRDAAAIGHFNIADSVQLNAVFAAAQELNLPV